MIFRLLLLALAVVATASPAVAQWQTPSGTIPVGRGAGVTGFNTVGGSAGAGAKCLLDTSPPTFGTCPGDSAGSFILFTTGQSFLTQTPALTWTPNPNVFVWNWDGVDGHIGTAFTAPSATTINMSTKMASDIADATGRKVYLINIAITGTSISHWLTGTGAPDMFLNIQNNITPALTAAGAAQINLGVWVQGPADTLPINQSYVANHATMMARFWADTSPGHIWFPREIPMIIDSMQSVADSNGLNADANNMNVVLNAVAVADPDKRRYVYLSSLSGSTYWDLTAHPTAQGHLAMGAMMASEFLRGTGRTTPQGVTVSPSTGNVTIGKPAYSATPYLINLNTSYVPTAGISGTARQVVGVDSVAVLDFLDVFGNLSEYIGRRANGTQAAKTTLVADDIITGLGAIGYDGTNYSAGARASILFQAAETWTASNRGTYAGLYLTPAGTDTIGLYYKFVPGSLTANGTTSGTYQIVFPAIAGTSVLKLPAGSTDFTATGGLHKFLAQSSAGAAVTVVQPAAADVSGLATSATTDTTNASNITSGTLPAARLGGMSVITNSLGANVGLTTAFADGPSVAQGTSGTWYATGHVTLADTAVAGSFICKLWDGTTVIDSGTLTGAATSQNLQMPLSGSLVSPAANIRISCKDTVSSTGLMLFNASGLSKDSTITAFRIN